MAQKERAPGSAREDANQTRGKHTPKRRHEQDRAQIDATLDFFKRIDAQRDKAVRR